MGRGDGAGPDHCGRVQSQFPHATLGPQPCRVLASMSFIPVAEDSDFPIHNLPYGVFSTRGDVSSGASASGRGEGVEWSAVEWSGMEWNEGRDGGLGHFSLKIRSVRVPVGSNPTS